MARRSAFINWKVGTRHTWGSLQIGGLSFTIPVLWTLAGLGTGALLAWGIVGGSFFVGWEYSFLPLMYYALGIGAFILLVLLGIVLSWVVRNVAETSADYREDLRRERLGS